MWMFLELLLLLARAEQEVEIYNSFVILPSWRSFIIFPPYLFSIVLSFTTD